MSAPVDPARLAAWVAAQPEVQSDKDLPAQIEQAASSGFFDRLGVSHWYCVDHRDQGRVHLNR